MGAGSAGSSAGGSTSSTGSTGGNTGSTNGSTSANIAFQVPAGFTELTNWQADNNFQLVLANLTRNASNSWLSNGIRVYSRRNG